MVRSRENLDTYRANRQTAIDQQHNEVLSNIHLVFYELYYLFVSSYRDLIWLTTSDDVGAIGGTTLDCIIWALVETH